MNRPEEKNFDLDGEIKDEGFHDPRAELLPITSIIEMLNQGEIDAAKEHLFAWAQELPDQPVPIPNPAGFARDFKAASLRNGIMGMWGYFEVRGQGAKFHTGGAEPTLRNFDNMIHQIVNDAVQKELSKQAIKPKLELPH